jgi:hypothetical protein
VDDVILESTCCISHSRLSCLAITISVVTNEHVEDGSCKIKPDTHFNGILWVSTVSLVLVNWSLSNCG